MSNCSRIKAVSDIAEKNNPVAIKASEVKFDYYAEDVFNEEIMQKYLSKDICGKLKNTIIENSPLDPALAGDIARAMKDWALDRGATHFTHWFQPLTGSTAEKHDSFFEIKNGTALMAFSGKNLIVGEPDASSFPSGGLRSTFEARGYTAWDPTSPAFIKRHANGATLCIPTAFCSYTGEALDKKTPLMRSLQALKKSVNRLMKCFNRTGEPVTVTLGPEQEYFLIDKKFYLNRPDLLQCGRTLFGAVPAKHQQLDDHYFGSIKPRILNFMTELEIELWKLGIPAKTRHNEAAPAQFEIAPIFEELNLAVDHNMLIMEMIRQVAERHGLVALLHEKPFAGVNGSGKHNNWSISYGNDNLLDPGDNPHQNAIFLTVLAAIIRAVDLHSDLLRTATAGAGNDHRLGANEAPPAIISIFLGDQLNEIIEQLEKGGKTSGKKASVMKIGVDALVPLPKDATDRNRTSPFAFTGNKFEFRGPGSSQSCAGACVIINTIVAESMDKISDELEQFSPEEFNTKLQQLLQKIIKKHKKIIFNGDNYSYDWEEEAGRRKLPNLRTTVEALQPLLKKENIELCEKYGVFSATEMKSRYEVFLSEYNRKIRIEGALSLEIAKNIILPVVQEDLNAVLDTLDKSMRTNINIPLLQNKASVLADNVNTLIAECNNMEKALLQNAAEIIDGMTRLRNIIDELETQVDDRRWPLPKYREMLFIY